MASASSLLVLLMFRGVMSSEAWDARGKNMGTSAGGGVAGFCGGAALAAVRREFCYLKNETTISSVSERKS